jgi:hypothetical protein
LAFTPENHENHWSLGMFHGHFWLPDKRRQLGSWGWGFTTRWSPRSATSRTVWGAKVLVPWRCVQGKTSYFGVNSKDCQGTVCMHPYISYCILFVFDIDLLNI